MRRMLVSCYLALTTVGCSAAADAVTAATTTGGGSTGTTGSHADYTTSWNGSESDEPLVTLTGSSPTYVDHSAFSLTQTTTVNAFTSAQFMAQFWVLDATNAQLAINGQGFSGFRLSPAGTSGFNVVTLPAGNWYLTALPNQATFPSYSNEVFLEVAWGSYPSWVQNGGVTLAATAMNPGGWKTQPFSVPSGDFRGRIETEGSAGVFAVMTAAQAQSFTSQYANGFNGGTIGYTYACGSTSGGFNLEIECEVKLPAGNYALVYINNSGRVAGGAGIVSYFFPQ